MNASTSAIKGGKAIEEGSWGAELYEGMEPDVLGNGDVVVSRHWNSRYVGDLPPLLSFTLLFLVYVLI